MVKKNNEANCAGTDPQKFGDYLSAAKSSDAASKPKSHASRHFHKEPFDVVRRLTPLAHGMDPNSEHERALRVFESFLASTMNANGEAAGTPATFDWRAWVDATLARDLDHKSLPHFVELVLQYYEGAQQAEKGDKAHADDKATRAEVRADYQADPSRFKNNKETAADYYKKIYPYKRTTIRDWLKGA